MQINPYLSFKGECEAAFKFYEQCLGGQLGAIFRYAGTPLADQVQADWQDKVMHGSLTVGEQVLMGGDVAPDRYEEPKGFSLSIQIESTADAERIFHELARDGSVVVPLEKTFWAARFGMVVDRFGIPWLINCEGSDRPRKSDAVITKRPEPVRAQSDHWLTWPTQLCCLGDGILVRVAAYQAPLLPCSSMEAVELIRTRVAWCEAEGVEILCCPEAVLGGLADYAARPTDIAMNVESGQLGAALTPLASNTVTTILGFTEIAGSGQLYNSAAVFHKGAVAGVYRKLYPAIRKSIYQAGNQVPVFRVGGLTFGILICNDSNYLEPARIMASQGATALFVPTNNGLPLRRRMSSLTLGMPTSPGRQKTACP